MFRICRVITILWQRIIKHSTAPLARHCILHGNYYPLFLIMQGFSSFHVAVTDRLLPRAAKGHIQNGTEPAMMLVVGNGYSAVPGFSQQNASRTGKNPQNKFLGVCWMQGEFDLMTSDYASHPQHFNHMVEAFVGSKTIPFSA